MSDITLKPCPFCYSDNVCISISPEMQDGRRFYYGFCYDCTMTSPEVSNEEGEGIAEEQAAEAWNSLPRHLRWTTETPTEPGWYLWKYEGEIEFVSVVCQGNKRIFQPSTGGKLNVTNRSIAGSQWAGPIPEPQEPK